MGGGGSSSNGQVSEQSNSLISDSLIALTHVLCEGPIKGFGNTTAGYYNNSSGAYSWDPLTAVYFNDVVVRNGDGSYNFNVSGQGFQFSYVLGTTGQLPMSGFEVPENIIPLISDTLISNPLSNAGLPKVITVTFNTTEYPDADSVYVTVRIPQCLTTSSNTINGYAVSYAVDISTNGGPFVNVDQQTINGKCTSPYFYTRNYVLPKPSVANNQSYYQWTVRVYKTSNDADSALTSDEIYVDTISVVAASQYSYPNTAMAGVFIDALQFGSIPSVAYLVNGLQVNIPQGYSPTTYSLTGTAASNPGVFTNISHGNVSGASYPNVWYGQFQSGVWTDNPAWIYNDLLTNTRYGLGRYLEEEPVDIWSLYEISQFCDTLVPDGYGGMEPQFTCNVYIREPDDAYNVLLNLASTFRGMLYYANGTIQPVQTDIQSNAIYVYSNANVINAEFNYSSTARNTRHTAAIVKYTDPLNLYRDNFVYVEDTQGIIQYGYNPKTISAFACTSPGQATRLGNWTLTTERLRTDTVSFQVGFDGLYVKPGDVFGVYDNFRNNKSQGGRILSYSADHKTIQLDRPVVLNSGMIYALSILSPTFDFFGFTGITGSDQIPEIRNEMVETQIVLTVDNPVNGSGGSVPSTSVLQVSGAFSTGIQNNALWLLSVSGIYNTSVTPTVFDQVTLYQCINVSESQPGIADVVALQYNTGINYIVNTGFTAWAIPPATGDFSVPAAPTNFTGQLITGQLSASNPNSFAPGFSFYEYLHLTWSLSSSSNASYYEVSGLAFNSNTWQLLGDTVGTGMTFQTATTGLNAFVVATVSKGGVYSAFQSFNYTFNPVPNVDPTQIRFWELPQAFGDLFQVAAFYNRPTPSTISTRVFYSPSGSTLPFAEVLDQSFYCAQGSIVNSLTSTGDTLSFYSTSYDMQRMQSQTTTQQNNDALLLLVDNELISIGTIVPSGGNHYGLTGVLREQMGTYATTHLASATGWLFYQSELTAFTNPDLYNLYAAGVYNSQIATKYFQVQNATLLVDGPIAPATPGLNYTLPNPAPNPPTSLVGTSPGGPIIHLSWGQSSSNNTLQYQVFKATAPFSMFTGAGATTNLFFDDINVTVGNTYEYYVTTEADNDQQSVASNTITIIPSGFVPSGVSINAPNDPTAATLTSSGTYLGIDGTLYAYLGFSLPAMTAGSQYQNVLYTRNGNILAQGTTASQVSNTATTGATIYDLTPGVSYQVGTQSVSNFGLFSEDVVAANGSPFIAPTTNSAPGTPVGLTAFAPGSNVVQLNWTANTESNLSEYGVYRGLSSMSLSKIANAGTNQYVDTNVAIGTTYYYEVSAINTTEQESALSSYVAVMPVVLTTGQVNTNAPANASAPTLSSSAYYLATDGTALWEAVMNVAALPSGASTQNLLYQKNGASNWTIACQLDNASSTTAEIFDLVVGTSYNIAIQAFSNFGVGSSLVNASANPYSNPSTSAPATPSNVVGSGGLGNTANFVALNWTANTEANLEEYGVYRHGSNSPTPVNPIAYVGANSFVDASVTGGSTYYYWVSAINRSEQVSANFAGPVGPFLVQGAPAAPTAPVLVGSGYYLTSDANVVNDFSFTIAALPAYALGQEVLYGTGNTPANMMIGNDLENSTSSVAVINDLTPGTKYYVAVKAYSQHGVPSTVVFGNGGNPYTAPGKTPFASVTAPTSVQIGNAQANQYPIATPSYVAGSSTPTLLAALTGSWVASTDKDIAFYEWYVNDFSNAPSNSQSVNPQQTVPSTQNAFVYYIVGAFQDLYLWVRAINKSQSTSSWTASPTYATAFAGSYVGTIGAQNYNSAILPDLTIAPIGSSSATSIAAQYYNSLIFTTPGGTTSGAFAVSIANCGFVSKPSYGTALLSSAQSNPPIYCLYNHDDASGSSSVAVFDVLPTVPGSTIPNQAYRFSVTLVQ